MSLKDMNKYLYLGNDTILKGTVLFIICLTYSIYHALIVLTFNFVFGYLFRKKQVDHSQIRAVDNTILLSPTSGKIKSIIKADTSITLKIQSSVIENYGLYLPLDCEITKSESICTNNMYFNKYMKKKYKHEISATSDLFDRVDFRIRSTFEVFKPRIWTMAGDLGTRGANFGFMPFGGFVDIILPVETKVLVSVGDEILSSQTILASSNKE
jgi:hypothetical protein